MVIFGGTRPAEIKVDLASELASELDLAYHPRVADGSEIAITKRRFR